MAEVGLSKDKLIQLLVTRIIKKNSFVPKPCKAVLTIMDTRKRKT
jgi:hypothetical protein